MEFVVGILSIHCPEVLLSVSISDEKGIHTYNIIKYLKLQIHEERSKFERLEKLNISRKWKLKFGTMKNSNRIIPRFTHHWHAVVLVEGLVRH